MSAYTGAFWAANLCNLFCLAGNTALLVLVPLHLERAGYPRWELGVIAGAFSLAGILIRIELGNWCHLRGRRFFFLFGCLLTALASLALASGFTQPLLVAAIRMVHGAGIAIYLTSIWTWVADLAPPERVGELQGMFGVSGLLAGALGPALGEALVARAGFPVLFLAAGVLSLAAFVGLLGLPDFHPQGAPSPASIFELMGRRSLAPMLGVSVPLGWAMGLVWCFLAPYGVTRGLSSVAPFFLAFSVASILVRLGTGSWLDRLGPERLIPTALACQVLSLLLLCKLAPSNAVVLLSGAALLYGLAHGVAYPALSLLTLRRTDPGDRSTGMALFTAAFDGGFLLGALASGLVAQVLSYPACFAVAASVLATSLAGFHGSALRRRAENS
ncbi:MAG: MFS transporter [Vulcanimicrobiota bacterium]